jgi:hypothetical protein
MAQHDGPLRIHSQAPNPLTSALVRAFPVNQDLCFGELLAAIDKLDSGSNCQDIAVELRRTE